MSTKADAAGTDRVQTLKNENVALKTQLKDLESKVKTFEDDLEKSTAMRTRLDKLCTELQDQSKQIKAESVAKIKDAEDRGKDLAQEMSSNLNFMDGINENLKRITGESLQVRKDNEKLGLELVEIKEDYEKREELLQTTLREFCDELVKTKTEAAQVRLKNAEDKERLLGDLQVMATTLVQSREQMKAAKETELELRLRLSEYDGKFAGLQRSLADTNTQYEGFKGGMDTFNGKTKDFEKEIAEWQTKWSESNASLIKMEQNYTKLQADLEKAHDGLTTMTNLCKALQKERQEMLKELKREDK